MNKRIAFSKYSGCGNDFILVDNRQQQLPQECAEIAMRLCHRRRGIGADGLLLLENSDHADYAMRIYNADGSLAEMCGNGIRCLGRFLAYLGISKRCFQIETRAGLLTLRLVNEDAIVEMGSIEGICWNIALEWQGQTYHLDYANTGVPHAMLCLPEISRFPLDHFGPTIRHHPRFAPQGANVNLYCVKEGMVHMRTYERGVEAETPACGTGAMAVAIAAAKHAGLTPPITVLTGWNEALIIDFKWVDDHRIVDLTLQGTAQFLYQGEIVLDK